MTSGPFDDLDDYLALPRVAGLAVSADGSRVVTTVAELNAKKTEYVTAIWELDPAGRDAGAAADPRRQGRSRRRCSPPTATCCSSRCGRPRTTTSRRPRCGGCPPRAARPPQLAELPGGVAAVRTARAAADGRRRRRRCCRRPTDVDDDRRLRALRKDNKVTAVLHTGYPVRHWDHDLGPRPDPPASESPPTVARAT